MSAAMVSQLSGHSRTDFPSPQRGKWTGQTNLSNQPRQREGVEQGPHPPPPPPPRLHSQPHVQLNPQLHVCCKERGFLLNSTIKRRPRQHVGERRRKKEGKRKKSQMGKSIRVCEKRSEWLAFPRWSSKGYFTPKSTYWLRAFGSRFPRRKQRNICWGNLHGIYFLH